MTLKPTFKLTLGDRVSTSDQAAFGPRSFVVERDMDIAADSLRIDLFQRPDASGATVDLDPASAAADVILELGHDGENEQVFSGKLVELRPTLNGAVIFALGKMNDLLNLHAATAYESQTAGGIVRDLVSQAGLETGTIDDGPTLPSFAVDQRLSAFSHVKGLADRLGYELYTDRQGKVYFHALGSAASLDSAGGGLLGAAAAAASSLLGLGGGGEGYQFGQHLIQAGAGRRQPSWGSVEVGGESPMSSQGASASHWLTVNDSDFRGSAGSGSPKLLVFDAAARSKDLADRFAAGRLAVAERTAHQVSFTILGRGSIELGDDLSLSAVPDALINGQGYVRAIRHRFSASGLPPSFRLMKSWRSSPADEDRWGAGFVTDLRVSLNLEDA